MVCVKVVAVVVSVRVRLVVKEVEVTEVAVEEVELEELEETVVPRGAQTQLGP